MRQLAITTPPSPIRALKRPRRKLDTRFTVDQGRLLEQAHTIWLESNGAPLVGRGQRHSLSAFMRMLALAAARNLVDAASDGRTSDLTRVLVAVAGAGRTLDAASDAMPSDVDGGGRRADPSGSR